MLHTLFCPLARSRTLVLALLLGLAPTIPAVAQGTPPSDETLFRDLESSGGYGAPTVAVTTIDGEARTIVGGQGGWILNRHLVIGGAARGLAVPPSRNFNDRSGELQLGYGGLLLEYIGAPSELVHYGANVVAGGGSAQLTHDDFDPQNDESFDATALFVTEAGARLELSATNYLRVGVTGGYRLVSGSDLQGVSDADLGGPYGGLSLRFGGF